VATPRPRAWLLPALLLAVGLAPTVSQGAVPRHRAPLILLRGTGACLSLFPRGATGCTPAAGFTNPEQGVAMSPDGSTIYLPSSNDALFGAVRRDPTSGRLSQPPGAPACWKGPLAVQDDPNNHASLCQPARGIAATTRWVAISPDGRSIYVASGPEDEGFGPDQTDAVAVFARLPGGGLVQDSGPAACVASAPFQGCSVRPGMSAESVAVDPGGTHVYVGGPVLTVFARDPGTGALTPSSCLSAAPRSGCGSAPLGLSLQAPVFGGGGRFAYALGGRRPTPGSPPDAQAILGLSVDPGTGALTPLPGAGACDTHYASLRSSCTLDRRLGPQIQDLTPTPSGTDLYLASTPVSYSLPASPGTPFQTLALRLDRASGAMTSSGAACVSSVPRPGCRLDRGVGAAHGFAVSPDGRRLYGVTDTDVVAFARRPVTGALRRLGRPVRGCRDPAARCARRRQPINGPQQVLVSPDGRFVYAVSSSFGDTGTVAALAVP